MPTKSVTLNWRAIWKTHDNWCRAQDGVVFYPDWPEQESRLQVLIKKQIRGMKIKVRIPWKRIWKEFEKYYENSIAADGDWAVQKRWLQRRFEKELRK